MALGRVLSDWSVLSEVQAVRTSASLLIRIATAAKALPLGYFLELQLA
jgi:hypothetical protein